MLTIATIIKLAIPAALIVSGLIDWIITRAIDRRSRRKKGA